MANKAEKKRRYQQKETEQQELNERIVYAFHIHTHTHKLHENNKFELFRIIICNVCSSYTFWFRHLRFGNWMCVCHRHRSWYLHFTLPLHIRCCKHLWLSEWYAVFFAALPEHPFRYMRNRMKIWLFQYCCCCRFLFPLFLTLLLWLLLLYLRNSSLVTLASFSIHSERCDFSSNAIDFNYHVYIHVYLLSWVHRLVDCKRFFCFYR